MKQKGLCLIVNIFGLDSASVGRFYACALVAFISRLKMRTWVSVKECGIRNQGVSKI